MSSTWASRGPRSYRRLPGGAPSSVRQPKEFAGERGLCGQQTACQSQCLSQAGPRAPGTSRLGQRLAGASVLVLNRLYMAVHVIGVRRAFGLLFRELAEVVHLEEGRFANYDFQSWREISELRADSKQPQDDWIRAVNFEIQVPRVIRLLSFDRLPKQELRLNRRNVLARDDHRCQYCGRHFPSQQLSIDHVIPRSRGGITSWENLVCACVACNVKKGRPDARTRPR